MKSGKGIAMRAQNGQEVRMEMSMQAGQVLYSRYLDGSRPVRVLERGFEVVDGPGQVKRFETAQGLLAELTGHPKGRHWTLERYFRRRPEPSPVWELFGAPEETSKPLVPLAPKLTRAISVPRPKKKKLVMGSPVVMAPTLGVDLATRAHEVRKLLYKCFGRKMAQKGFDPEEVLQEVYQGLLVRNAGKCPWDPRISSFGSYVCMVISCILSNYARKKRRIRDHEQVGITGFDDGAPRLMDVAESPHLEASPSYMQTASEVEEAHVDLVAFMLDRNEATDQTRLAISIISDVTAGMSRRDIADKHSCSMSALSRAISLLRAESRAWGGRV